MAFIVQLIITTCGFHKRACMYKWLYWVYKNYACTYMYVCSTMYVHACRTTDPNCLHDHGASGSSSLPTGVANRPAPPSAVGLLSVAASSSMRWGAPPTPHVTERTCSVT
jgi:hypothetical protein